jgi:hypothetical protein
MGFGVDVEACGYFSPSARSDEKILLHLYLPYYGTGIEKWRYAVHTLTIPKAVQRRLRGELVLELNGTSCWLMNFVSTNILM